MELILGLPPLSASSTPPPRPMFASFTDKADLTPYAHEPARIDLDAVNDRLGLRRRAVEPDGLQRVRQDRRLRAQRDPLAAVKGKDAPLPPAVRRAIAYRPEIAKP